MKGEKMGSITITRERGWIMEYHIWDKITSFFITHLWKSKKIKAESIGRKIDAKSHNNRSLLVNLANFADNSIAEGLNPIIHSPKTYYHLHLDDQKVFIIAQIINNEIHLWLLDEVGMAKGLNLEKDKPFVSGHCARQFIIDKCIK